MPLAQQARARRVLALATFALAALAPSGRLDAAGLFDHPEERKGLNLDAPGARGWSVAATAISPLAGIAYPGDTVRIELEVRNRGSAALTKAPFIEIVRLGTRFARFERPPAKGKPPREICEFFPAAEPLRLELEPMRLPPGGKAAISWKTEKPAQCAEPGLYAVIVEFPKKGRQVGATFARVRAPNPAAGDGKGDALVYPLDPNLELGLQLDLVKRLGFHWVRSDGMPSLASVCPLNVAAPFDWSKADEWIAAFRKRGLYIIASLAGAPRHAISDANWRAGNRVHDPKYDERFGDFVEQAVARYCGEDGTGPLRMIDFWHEPWEGGSPSGWKCDAPRYRALYRIVYDRARRASRRVTVGGTSSIGNTFDKLFSPKGGQAEWGPRLGVLTDRGVPPHGCFGPRVGIKLITTSVELAAPAGGPDALIAAATHLAAAGQRKVCPRDAAGFFWENGPAGPMCAPAAVAASFFLHFTAGLEFERVAARDHLPWIYQWGRGDRVGFILAGDRSRLAPGVPTMYDQVRADGTIAVDTMEGRLRAYDQYGAAYSPREGRFVVPCSGASVYFEAPGLPAPMVAETLASGRIEGVAPVEFFADDFLVPVSRLKAVEFDVHNVLGRQVTGTVTVVPPSSIGLEQDVAAINLPAGATRSIRLPVAWTKPHPANAYPFTFRFKGAAGKAQHSEELHANTIPRGTPAVDGHLTDWVDVVPVVLRSPDVEFSLAEAAWRPWETRKDVARGMAEIRMMWDARHLYLAVRERARDWKPKPRLSTRNDADYFGTGDLAHTYIRDPSDALPYTGHCVQLGIRFRPFRTRLPPAGVAPDRMVAADDTDYEYAIWGTPDGGAEVWRSAAPDLGFFNFLPRCMPEGYDGVPKGAAAVVRRQGDDTIYEVAIPLADMPGLVPAAGKSIRIAIALPGSGLELGAGRSRPRGNSLTLRPTWASRLSNDIRWAFIEK